MLLLVEDAGAQGNALVTDQDAMRPADRAPHLIVSLPAERTASIPAPRHVSPPVLRGRPTYDHYNPHVRSRPSLPPLLGGRVSRPLEVVVETALRPAERSQRPVPP